jgi:hypothetical protein
MTTVRARVQDEEARLLKAFAQAENVSVSEVIRTAFMERIERRRKSRDFQERLRRARERKSEDFELLTPERGGPHAAEGALYFVKFP